MSVHSSTHVRVHSRAGMILVVIGVVLMAAGCGKNYGRFSKNAEVDLAFRQGDHQPGYQYFYAGRDNMPYAIIGIDRNYNISQNDCFNSPLRDMEWVYLFSFYPCNGYYPVAWHNLPGEQKSTRWK